MRHPDQDPFEASLGAARDRLRTLVHPHGETSVWGVDSFAVLPVHAGLADLQGGEQIGHRMRCLRGIRLSRGSGFCLAIADRDALLTAPGMLRNQRHCILANGAPCNVPRTTENCASRSDMS